MSIPLSSPAPRAARAHDLKNCLANAIEAKPPGGAVVVSNHEAMDGSQAWAFRDTGPDIREGVPQCFGTSFVTSRERGSGVGFALGGEIVGRQHGGRLHVRTLEGSGTVASIGLATLPPGAFAQERSRPR